MKTKARLLALLMAMAILSGCSKSKEVDAVQLYKDSFAKAKEMESYNMDSSMSMKVDFVALETKIDMTSAVIDKGETAAHELSISSNGETQDSLMYQKDGFFYSSIPDSEQFLKQSYEEGTGLSYQSLLNIGSGDMAQSYIDAIDSAKELTVTNEKGAVKVAFDFSEESLTSMTEDITSMLAESMMGTLEEELYNQMSALELPEEELNILVGQMVEVYRNMFSDVTVERIHMEKTVGEDGFATQQKMSMDLNMDMSELLTALGETVDEETAKLMQNIGMSMSVDSNYSNINGDVKVEIPELNIAE